MSIKTFILLSMIMCHIIADYPLQGILASMKQKKYWKDQDRKYRKDYIMALFMHSFSWSYIIIIPCIIYLGIYSLPSMSIYIINIIIHMIVDDLKANRNSINLIQDQIIHLMQILITWKILI